MQVIIVRCVNHNDYTGHPDENPHTRGVIRHMPSQAEYAEQMAAHLIKTGCICGGEVKRKERST